MSIITGNLTVLNVTDYGAKGNGTHDDTGAINAALAAAAQYAPQVGAIVYLPTGIYSIAAPLMRLASYTRCVGEGKTATTIKLNASTWKPTISPTDPVGAFIFDLSSTSVTDCAVTDMRIDGSSLSIQLTSGSTSYSGILCSLRDEIARVSFLNIWGYNLWISDTKAAYVRVIDCEANGGQSGKGDVGNDCIGGGAVRTKIVRFYWMPGLQKNSALDFTTGGGMTFAERSVDILDCINESPEHVTLEGLVQSTIRGNRFYGNNLSVKSDAAYSGHPKVTNPADVLVTDNVFVGVQNAQMQYVGGSCYAFLDGGMIYCSGKGTPLNNPPGGRIAILGNTFINSAGRAPTEPGSAIVWAGDDVSNSSGGSVIFGQPYRQPQPERDHEYCQLCERLRPQPRESRRSARLRNLSSLFVRLDDWPQHNYRHKYAAKHAIRNAAF